MLRISLGRPAYPRPFVCHLKSMHFNELAMLMRPKERVARAQAQQGRAEPCINAEKPIFPSGAVHEPCTMPTPLYGVEYLAAPSHQIAH